jgi:hypothetical protein
LPRQVQAFTHRGFIQLRLGYATQAHGDFDAVLAIDAKNVVALYGRGLAKWQDGDSAGAQSDIAAAEKSKPDIVNAVTKYYGVAPQRNLSSRLAIADLQQSPMVFAVVHGDDGACGPGCSEWIAADGSFDHDVENRLRDFLDGLKGRKLPIFFDSNGGFITDAFVVGRMLRERDMQASLGITIPDGCPADKPRDDSCRQRLREGLWPRAQLRTAGAICFSSCTYAFMGASVRQVPDGALFGVHATLRPDLDAKFRNAEAAIDDRAHAQRRQYVEQMGVDPDLVDFADATPFSSLHVLTRDEIARFRVETPQH